MPHSSSSKNAALEPQSSVQNANRKPHGNQHQNADNEPQNGETRNAGNMQNSEPRNAKRGDQSGKQSTAGHRHGTVQAHTNAIRHPNAPRHQQDVATVASVPVQQEFPQLAVGMLKEINRLHEVARRQAKLSRQALDGALFAAWHAGKLLAAAKKRIRRKGGPGAWVPWVKMYFNGGLRTAQRYMRLARSANAPTCLPGLSLRQAYFRLGIAIEPKGANGDRRDGFAGNNRGGGDSLGDFPGDSAGESAGDIAANMRLAKLSPHITLANRLSRLLRVMRRRIHVQDLAPLYAQLQAIFEHEGKR